jgi:hypothetical protein
MLKPTPKDNILAISWFVALAALLLWRIDTPIGVQGAVVSLLAYCTALNRQVILMRRELQSLNRTQQV